jgi:CheY-like chemotaxis protein
MVNILLVEPEQACRERVWTALEDAGYTVIAAGSYAEAEVLLAIGQWDALLTAVDAGGGDGVMLADKAGTLGVETLFLDADLTILAARRGRRHQHRPVWLLALAAHVRALSTRPGFMPTWRSGRGCTRAM